MIFERSLSGRRETLLRISSAVPCGLLIYLGNYWRDLIVQELTGLPTRTLPLDPIVLYQMIISGFAFIVIVLVNTFGVTKLILGNQIDDKEKIKSYDELAGTAIVITFFLALGGMGAVDVVIIVATILALLKIIKPRRTGSGDNLLFSSISTGERIFWSIFTKKRIRSRTFFFYANMSLSAFILLVNLGFIDFGSPSQILFLFFPATAAFLGYWGIRKEWTKIHQMILACMPYLGAFLLVMAYPRSMPFNSFLYNSLIGSGVTFSNNFLYAVPLIFFTLIFGLLTQLPVLIASEESRNNRPRYLIYGYVGNIIAYLTFALVFELFFLQSISSGWFNVLVGDQKLIAPFQPEAKTILLVMAGGVLAIGSFFSAVASHATLKSSPRQNSGNRVKIRIGLFLFSIFLASTVVMSISDSYLIAATQTNEYISGKVTVEKDSAFNSIPIRDTDGWMQITAKSLSGDIVNASVYDEGGYKHKEFEITNGKTTTVLNNLDRMNYEITFKVVRDADGDNKSDIMIDIRRGSMEKQSGILAVAGIWNFILLIPYARAAIDI